MKRKGNPRPSQTSKLALFPDLCELLHFTAMLKDALAAFHNSIERTAKEKFELGYMQLSAQWNHSDAAKALVRILDFDPKSNYDEVTGQRLSSEEVELPKLQKTAEGSAKIETAKYELKNYCAEILCFESPTEKDVADLVCAFEQKLLGGELSPKLVRERYLSRFAKTLLANADFENLAETFDYSDEAKRLALHIFYSGLAPASKRSCVREIFKLAVKFEGGRSDTRETRPLQKKLEELQKNFGMLGSDAKSLADNKRQKQLMCEEATMIPLKLCREVGDELEKKLKLENLPEERKRQIKEELSPLAEKLDPIFGNVAAPKELVGMLKGFSRSAPGSIQEVIAKVENAPKEKPGEFKAALEILARGNDDVETSMTTIGQDSEEFEQNLKLGLDFAKKFFEMLPSEVVQTQMEAGSILEPFAEVLGVKAKPPKRASAKPWTQSKNRDGAI